MIEGVLPRSNSLLWKSLLGSCSHYVSIANRNTNQFAPTAYSSKFTVQGGSQFPTIACLCVGVPGNPGMQKPCSQVAVVTPSCDMCVVYE